MAYSSRTKSTSKRRRNPSYQEFRELAEEKGVGETYRTLLNRLRGFFDARSRSKTSVALIGEMDGRQNTIFNLLPAYSSAQKGLRFRVFTGGHTYRVE